MKLPISHLLLFASGLCALTSCTIEPSQQALPGDGQAGQAPLAGTRYGSDDLANESGAGGMVPGQTQFSGNRALAQQTGMTNDGGFVQDGATREIPSLGDPNGEVPAAPQNPADLGGQAPATPQSNMLANGQPDPDFDYPRGVPVPSMPGHVYSPYSRDEGIVDVSEYPSGLLVRDPFKTEQQLYFRVP